MLYAPPCSPLRLKTGDPPHNDAMIAGIRIPYHTLKQMWQAMPELSSPSKGRTIEYLPRAEAA